MNQNDTRIAVVLDRSVQIRMPSAAPLSSVSAKRGVVVQCHRRRYQSFVCRREQGEPKPARIECRAGVYGFRTVVSEAEIAPAYFLTGAGRAAGADGRGAAGFDVIVGADLSYSVIISRVISIVFDAKSTGVCWLEMSMMIA